MSPAATRRADAALLLPSLAGGGLERVMLNLAQGLAGEGLEVDLLVAWPQGTYADRLPEGVRVVSFRASRMARAFLPLALYLRRERPRSLLAGLDYANVIALWARRLARAPTRVVISGHKHFSEAVPGSPLRRDRLLLPTAVRLSYPQADAIVSVSHDAAEDLALVTRLPPSRIQVIWNPVVTDELFTAMRASVDHPWLEPGQPPLVVNAARLAPNKDHATLLRAFALARLERPLRLLILGDGEERPRLERLVRELEIEDDVELPGFSRNPYPYLSGADLYATASTSEALPTAMIEALACGTPVVATDCRSGPAEVLDGGRFGRLVPERDAQALARAMLKTLERPPDPDELRSRAADFGLRKAVESYRAVLGV